MDKINSLKELIYTLKHSDAENYATLAKNMVLPVSDFEKYAHWKEDGYARNCIIKTPEFELILICWKGKDATPIHGHNDQKCWVYLIEGELTEIRYQQDSKGNLSESNNLQMNAGNLSYMHDSMGLHLLKSTSEQKAMTLHLYMKPIDTCEVFNDSTSCLEDKTLRFHSMDGELLK